jgi:hypothetical protein
MYAIISHNSNGVLIACDGIGLRDFKDIIQINDSLGNSVIMIVNTVSQFPVIIKNKPPSLPPFVCGTQLGFYQSGLSNQKVAEKVVCSL